MFCWTFDQPLLGPTCLPHMRSFITGHCSAHVKPSQSVDMESVRNYLLSHRQSQKTYFNRGHGAHDLIELGPGQEVLFRSLIKDEYIPGTIVKQATVPSQLHHGGPKQKVLQNKGTHVAYPPQYPQYCTDPVTTPKGQTLPSPAFPSLTPNTNTLHAIPHSQAHVQSPTCYIHHPPKFNTAQTPKVNVALSVKDL